jgi:hypothetical protein
MAAAGLWEGVEQRLEGLEPGLVRDNGLGAFAARVARLRGEDAPEQLAREERAARAAALVAPVVLARVRAAYDGPLLLVKGPELSRRYPDGTRGFGDLDLIAADPEQAQAALLAAGFLQRLETVAPDFYDRHHHLHPLEWPGLALPIEIHRRVMWPRGFEAPANDELFEAALPASFGVEGLLVPDPRHHALLLAAHSWGEDPMRKLRDLVDVLAFTEDDTRNELARLARRWGFERGWNATLAVADWLLRGGPEPRFVGVWARYLRELREPTVLEMHVRAWLLPFSIASPLHATRLSAAALLHDLRPTPYENWDAKLHRTVQAVLHLGSPRSQHHTRLGRLRRRAASDVRGTGTAEE